MNGFETITRLGGYILIFSLLSAFIRHYVLFSRVSGGLLLGITEITTGLHTLSALSLPYDWLYLFSMCATAFGGLCILAQTKSVLNRQLSAALCGRQMSQRCFYCRAGITPSLPRLTGCPHSLHDKRWILQLPAQSGEQAPDDCD